MTQANKCFFSLILMGIACTLVLSTDPSNSSAIPAGYYCNEMACPVQCALGSFCPSGSSIDAPCPAGHWCPSPDTKNECSRGNYCPGGNLEEIPCPYGASACMGVAHGDGDGLCAVGHRGFACATCVEGFYRNEDIPAFPCIECGGALQIAGRLLLSSLFYVAFAGVTVYQFLRASREMRESVGVGNGHLAREHDSVVQRIAISNIQVMLLVEDILPKPISSMHDSVVKDDTASWPSFSPSDMSFGGAIDCAIRPTWMEVPIFNSLISVLLVLGAFLLVRWYWTSWHPFILRKRKKVTSDRKEVKIFMSMVVLLHLMYLSFAQTLFAMFTCDQYEEAGEDFTRWRNALEVKCFHDVGHWVSVGILAVPYGLALVLGLPLTAFVVLRRHRDELRKPEIAETYGFLYKGYRSGYWFWDLVILARKLLVAAVGGFLATASPSLRVGVLLLIMVVSSAVQLMFKPYESTALNRLEILGTSCVILFFVLVHFETDWKESKGTKTFAIMTLFAVNIFWYWIVFGVFVEKGKRWLEEKGCRKKKAGVAGDMELAAAAPAVLRMSVSHPVSEVVNPLHETKK